MIKVHTFNKSSTGEVYDLSQCTDHIEMGDVLVVPKEGVVGFLLAAWPTAVTVKCGKFHSKNPNTNWEVVCNQPGDDRDWMPSVTKAMEVANELGFPIGDRDTTEDEDYDY